MAATRRACQLRMQELRNLVPRDHDAEFRVVVAWLQSVCSDQVVTIIETFLPQGLEDMRTIAELQDDTPLLICMRNAIQELEMNIQAAPPI